MELACEIAKSTAPGSVFCLSGELGAGKTAFAQGFARGLGVDGYVASPTFTIMNIYSGRIPLYHFDAYRMADADEFENTVGSEYFYEDGVCLIEWAELIREVIPENAVWIHILKDLQKDENYRKILIQGKL